MFNRVIAVGTSWKSSSRGKFWYTYKKKVEYIGNGQSTGNFTRDQTCLEWLSALNEQYLHALRIG